MKYNQSLNQEFRREFTQINSQHYIQLQVLLHPRAMVRVYVHYIQ